MFLNDAYLCASKLLYLSLLLQENARPLERVKEGLSTDADDRRGVGIDFGYKMKLKSLFKKSGTYRPDHILHGSYAKPMIGFHALTKRNYSDSETDFKVMNVGLDIGKQWILNKTVSLDLHIGFHYYGGSIDRSNTLGIFDEASGSFFQGGDLIGSNNTATSIGFRIGYLFGSYGDQQKGNRKRR